MFKDAELNWCGCFKTHNPITTHYVKYYIYTKLTKIAGVFPVRLLAKNYHKPLAWFYWNLQKTITELTSTTDLLLDSPQFMMAVTANQTRKTRKWL